MLSRAFNEMIKKFMSIFAFYLKNCNFSTMGKYTLLMLLFMTCAFNAKSQLIVEFTGGSVDPGSTISVDVTVSDFNQLFGVQYSINWDSTVLQYSSITNVTAALPGFDVGAIGVPPGSTNIDPGEITVSWFQSNPQSLPNDTRLFTIVFNAYNVPCDSTNIIVSGTPLAIEVTDSNFNDIGISFTPTPVYVNGTNCGGGSGNNNLTFTCGTAMAQTGTEVCVPIKVKNFNGFNAGQGKFSWNPAIISFVKIQNQTSGSFNDNTNNTPTGMYNFLWENLDPANPVSLPDGTTFFEVCFNAVGAAGTNSTIDLTSFAADWGFTDASGAEPPITLVNGKVTIVDNIPDPVILNISDITINQGNNGCVSITVENFTNVLSAQGTFTWNNTVAAYSSVTGFGAISGLSASDFNLIVNNKLRLTWNAPSGSTSGITVADGTEIFKICFDGIGPCPAGGTTLVDFVDQPNFDIEFTVNAGGSPFEIEHTINSGMITVNCAVIPPTCAVTGKTDVKCNGATTGSIQVSILNAMPTCQCIWYKDGATTPFRTLTSPNCNLIDVGAGTYKLDLVCGGTVVCTSTATITQPTAITINGMVTNVSCDNPTGSIVLSTDSGGTPVYTYKWNDVNSTTSKDLTSVGPGMYTVTITDSNMCTGSREFTITNSKTPLVVVETVTSVSCFGMSNGSIVLNISGGCPGANGYTVTPSTLTGLAVGTYSVTVSDASSPVLTWTKDIVITGPAEALSLEGVPTPSTGTDGTITTTSKGGTMPYTIKWTGGIADNQFNPTGLAPGTYIGTLTDAKGCVTSATFIVKDESDPEKPVVNSVSAINVSCSGLQDGSVSAIIASGAAPFKVDILQGTTVIKTINVTTATTFTIPGLKAGSYTLRVTGSKGQITDNPVIVSQPTPITFDTTIDCANGSNNDGTIDLTTGGGAGNFSYEWSTGAMTEDLTNIGVGTYSVLIEDNNGCQAIINNLRVADCNPTNCYEAIKIITPNGDGINDAFVINCVMQEQTKLTLYDRWGRQVFTQNNYDNSWVGVNQTGETLIEGGYMWVLEVEFTDNRKEVFKGTVTILTQN